MKDQDLIFIDLLQSEIERLVIPDPKSEMSRNTSILAARQLRRLVVDKTVVPGLRREAIIAYRTLLPSMQTRISDELHSLLTDLLATDVSNWGQLEAVLSQVATSLLASGDALSHGLFGKLVTIDAQLRAGKEQAWQARNKIRADAADSISRGNEEDDGHSRLLDFIKQAFPKEVALRIASVKQIPGGFSKQTLFVNLENNIELPSCLVMRRDAPYVTTGSSVTMEFPVIQKMFAAGVAVPQPFLVDQEAVVYGRPFILLARAAGRNIGDFIAVTEPSRAVALDLAQKMASLHAAPFDGLEHILPGGTITVRERLKREIDEHEAMWKGTVNQSAYIVQAALDWLKANLHLADGPRCVTHKDIGVHNLLVDDDRIAAFLDWECCAIGTPAEDIGYAYYTVVQMADWEDFLSAYEAHSGVALNRRQVDFYALWACIRVAVGILRMVDPVFSGERMNLAEYYLGDYFGQVVLQRIATKLAEVVV